MDFRGNPAVLPPAECYAEMARRVSDPVAARGYMTLAKHMQLPHAELVMLERQGLAYELPDGTLIPGVNVGQVRAALTSAQAASMTPGDGGPCDDPGLRRWLEQRCRVLGLPAPEWAPADAPASAGSRPPGRSETAGKGLMTSVRVPVGSTITTPGGERYRASASPAALADRESAFAKAARYDQYAQDAALDPALRESYRQLAARTRREESRA